MLKVMYSIVKMKELTSNSKQNTCSFPSYGVYCACIAKCRCLSFVCFCADPTLKYGLPARLIYPVEPQRLLWTPLLLWVTYRQQAV